MFSQSQNSDQVLFVYKKNDCIIDLRMVLGVNILKREYQSAEEYAGIIERELLKRVRIDFVIG